MDTSFRDHWATNKMRQVAALSESPVFPANSERKVFIFVLYAFLAEKKHNVKFQTCCCLSPANIVLPPILFSRQYCGCSLGFWLPGSVFWLSQATGTPGPDLPCLH